MKFNWFHVEDNLLDSITSRDLITMIRCNEPGRDRKTIERVFNELLKIQVDNAKEMFKQHYKDIRKELTL